MRQITTNSEFAFDGDFAAIVEGGYLRVGRFSDGSVLAVHAEPGNFVFDEAITLVGGQLFWFENLHDVRRLYVPERLYRFDLREWDALEALANSRTLP